jgi:hypothetical protein
LIPELRERLALMRLKPVVMNIDRVLSSSETKELKRKLLRAIDGEPELPPV